MRSRQGMQKIPKKLKNHNLYSKENINIKKIRKEAKNGTDWKCSGNQSCKKTFR